MWLLVLLGCDDDAAAPQHVTPWVYEEPPGATEALSPEVLAASLSVVVSTLQRVDPGLTHVAYLDALGSFDATCPAVSRWGSDVAPGTPAETAEDTAARATCTLRRNASSA